MSNNGYNMINADTVERSVAYDGNAMRLALLMKRAEKGERLTLAFLGGSITQGSLSSTPETCYAYLVYEWFKKTFPKASFEYVNAGIGGTTSQFGVTRVDRDVLSHDPDLCMLEFSVNDDNTVFFRETYEGVLRRLWYAESEPAVLILHNLFYEDGRNTQEQHALIGESYDIPCISIRDAIWPEIEAGRIDRPDITPDNLHPNDKGHAMLAGFVTEYLEYIRTRFITCGEELEEPVLPIAPITVNALEHLTRSEGWTASEPGESFTYTFTGSELAVQYIKTVTQPAPVVTAVIDGDEEHPYILDANFKETWGDCLYIDTLMYHGRRVCDPNAWDKRFRAAEEDDGAEMSLTEVAEKEPVSSEHKLVLTVSKAGDDDRSPFKLLSVMTA